MLKKTAKCDESMIFPEQPQSRNQLDKNLHSSGASLLLQANEPESYHSNLSVSNENLARQGDIPAISRYLSESLSSLGVSVEVKSKPLKFNVGSQTKMNQEGDRLWVFCQSTYSHDPELLAEPIAQKLRHLNLENYGDALIVSQVLGETNPDWLLRVDLTLAETMVQEWARWGDLEAIDHLLNQSLSNLGVSVTISLQKFTLHIFCYPTGLLKNPPEKEECLPIIANQLENIGPQGVLSATVYGQSAKEAQPEWIDWLSLPAAENTKLSTPTKELAASGDQGAIIFLLERLLNHDIDWRLRTGGIRILTLQKGNILHIMCDATTCPPQEQVADKVTEFAQQIRAIAGVRIYGRRAGDRDPLWRYGVNFRGTNQALTEELVLVDTPKFASIVEYKEYREYNSSLVNYQPSSNLTKYIYSDSGIEVEEESEYPSIGLHQQIKDLIKKLLLTTQVFIPIQNQRDIDPKAKGISSGFLWLVLGIILIIQSDWLLGNLTMIRQQSQGTKHNQPKDLKLSNSSDSSPSSNTWVLSQHNQVSLEDSSMNLPSFNAKQLDAQLALYRKRLKTDGKPPDILILGSSRALRGIDPSAIGQTLASRGYPEVSIFNLGINGSTAQVVEFVICQVLTPAELPKIIIWGDGSRAFNNGRLDITFNAIAASQGYKEVLKRANERKMNENSSVANKSSTENNITNITEINSQQVANEILNEYLANLSLGYQKREEIKKLFFDNLNNLDLINNYQKNNNSPGAESNINQFNGFLPISIKFDAKTYYQKYPKVFGAYDSDYKDFQLDGMQHNALNSILQFTQKQQIHLIFINMPLTTDYLDSFRSKYERKFKRYMLGNARENPNFTYRDFSRTWKEIDEYFSDPSHLNRYGAHELSQKLATDMIIPWLKK
ncbi:hypothetical protein [Cylindrospermopsis raciborskii]|uniref:hypothetical protein n=1 Tax=Cylindrospermopsis raciborskii TaxID=77022 RepID=UPI000C9DF7E7|nr:hypothetical protein [Cylindrospermopsis raciborskii]PNK15073.1 hypothetical protein CEP07_12300 [Cylindrospermopsis raciborskii S01]